MCPSSLLFSRLDIPSSIQPLLMGLVLQTLHQLCSPSLYSLQQLSWIEESGTGESTRGVASPVQSTEGQSLLWSCWPHYLWYRHWRATPTQVLLPLLLLFLSLTTLPKYQLSGALWKQNQPVLDTAFVCQMPRSLSTAGQPQQFSFKKDNWLALEAQLPGKVTLFPRELSQEGNNGIACRLA